MTEQAIPGREPGLRGAKALSITDWLDHRMGLRALLGKLLDEPIPGGPRLAYVLGSALLAIFLLQVVSGTVLLLYYVPSADHAHSSLAYVVKSVWGGSFIRGLHFYGASAIVILLLLHVAQTFLYGSYKGGRELQWISGGVLLLLVLGMGFTGYLLPWDEKAYFATKVGTNVPSEIPVVGNLIKRLLLGGSTLGALTLSRFFVLHVFILFGLIVLFIGLHLYLLRRRGPAGPTSEDPSEPRLKTAPFYPGQLTRDLTFATLVIVIVCAFAYLLPPGLGPRANPADTQFLPRPDWYFRFLFQWMKYWPGRTVLVGLGLIPLIVAVLFFGLPFFDRRRERRPWRRPVAVGVFTVSLAGLALLTALSYSDDARDPAVAAQMARQRAEEQIFMQFPFTPDLAALPAPDKALIAQGAALFKAHNCPFCHGEGGVGGEIGPRLVGISGTMTPEQVFYLLHHPTAKMKKAGMTRALNFNEEEFRAVVAYVESLR